MLTDLFPLKSVSSPLLFCITKTLLFKYIENFTYKNWNFLIKRYFYTPVHNIDRWGGSKEYPQTMFLSKNKKNNVNACKPQFYYIKAGFKGVKII